MYQLNMVLLEGRLTHMPEAYIISEDYQVCKFSIAQNRPTQGEPEVQYFNIEAWNKLADFAMLYLDKGKPVRVTGRLRENRWEDEEGKKHTKLHVVADTIDFLPSAYRPPSSDASATDADDATDSTISKTAKNASFSSATRGADSAEFRRDDLEADALHEDAPKKKGEKKKKMQA